MKKDIFWLPGSRPSFWQQYVYMYAYVYGDIETCKAQSRHITLGAIEVLQMNWDTNQSLFPLTVYPCQTPGLYYV